MGRRIANQLAELLPAPAAEEIQLQRVLTRVKAARDHVPFYTQHLADVDVSAITTLDEFRRVVPFTDKQALLEGLPPAFASDETSAVRAVHLTSGTSGIGQEVHQRHDDDIEAVGVGFAYQLLWAGIQPGHRVGLTIPYGTTMAGPFGIKGCEIAGAVPIYLGGLDAIDKLARATEYRLNALWCTPAYLRRLTSVARAQGLDPRVAMDSLRAIIISGETYQQEWAREAGEFWGVPLFEMYGLTQSTGAIFATCEVGVAPDDRAWGRLHAFPHRCLVEVLRPGTNEPCAPGDRGEIVITELHDTWFPSIRFRTGDSAEYLGVHGCSCGRTAQAIRCGSIMRLDDRLKIRATNVWPAAFDAVLLEQAGAEEYQGRVYMDGQGRECVSILVEWPEADTSSTSRDLGALAARVKEVTGVAVDLESVPAGALPRYDFKVRRWVDERVERNVVNYVEHGGHR